MTTEGRCLISTPTPSAAWAAELSVGSVGKGRTAVPIKLSLRGCYLEAETPGLVGKSGKLCFLQAHRLPCREWDPLCLGKTRATLGQESCFCMGDIVLQPSFPLRAKSLSCASPFQLATFAPCYLSLSFSSASAGAAVRAKDPPWMALVQAEPKKKPAPPPPPGSSHESPSRAPEEEDGVGKARSEESRPDAVEPKPYNPFEEDDEEEEESAATQKSTPEQEQSEAAARPLHPWYGITPTSSPKTKKRPAPRAPSASPLGELPPAPLSLLHSPLCGLLEAHPFPGTSASPWQARPLCSGGCAGTCVSSLPTGTPHLQTRPLCWMVPSVFSEDRHWFPLHSSTYHPPLLPAHPVPP